MTVALRLQLDPKAEFRQIFNEGWRYQRDYLYVANQQGADWPRMKTMYGALLPHVMHRADLTYLLDMMGAEIAVGHSYVRGGDLPDGAGHLRRAPGRRHRGRERASPPDPDLRRRELEPRAARAAGRAGVDVAAGDYLVSINGVELTGADNLHQRLDGTANRQTVLGRQRAADAHRRAAGHGGARAERSGPAHPRLGGRESAAGRQAVGRAAGLRLRPEHRPAWLRRASIATTSPSRTRPARSSTSATTAAARLPTTSSTCSAAISTATSTTSPATACRSPVPSAGIWGPKVMIINEMAGSGGDLMPYMFRRRKIGPLVGTRTWGGLVHTRRHAAVRRRRHHDCAPRRLLHARRQVGDRERGRRAGHRGGELAQGGDRGRRSAARTRRAGSAAPAARPRRRTV